MPITADMSFDTHLPDPDRDAQFYAGVPVKRLIAWFVDFLVIAVLSTIMATIIGLLTLGFGFLLFPAVALAVAFLYRTLTIAGASSTWGMRLMGIEFRTRTGDRFDLGHAAFHTLIFMLLMASFLGWIATVFCIMATRYHQGIPDLILGSTAINQPLD